MAGVQTSQASRLAAGTTLVVGMNQHPYTDSLLPLIKEFETSTGIPVSSDVELLYYRQDLFDQQGLAVPATMDELYETAVTLNNPGQMAGICLRGRKIFTVMPFSGFLWSYGGQHFDDIARPQKATFDSPAGLAALELSAI